MRQIPEIDALESALLDIERQRSEKTLAPSVWLAANLERLSNDAVKAIRKIQSEESP